MPRLKGMVCSGPAGRGLHLSCLSVLQMDRGAPAGQTALVVSKLVLVLHFSVFTVLVSALNFSVPCFSPFKEQIPVPFVLERINMLQMVRQSNTRELKPNNALKLLNLN